MRATDERVTPVKIGTRGSALALWQAQTVARLIAEAGGPACEIVVIRTSGDEGSAVAESSEPTTNVKRLFVKEIEDALLEGRVDLAVHSSKDLAAHLPDGLTLAATLEREDPRDALILPAPAAPADFKTSARALGPTPRIGTSSVRRVAELRAQFPGATFAAIRGNVDTRLRKLDAGECDALVLAAAGLKRLGLAARISALIPTDVCLPAPGQGIVAIEVASGGTPTIRDAVARICDPDALTMLTAERAVVAALGGGCQMPLGVLATLDGSALDVAGLVASLDGRRIIRATVHGNRGGAAAAGDKLAALLLKKGAAEILDRPPTER
ncbi:MAG TPA: hydroxymethylbilane synthase [Vicinamibacterales bacterium]|nr:hydroxymethylbilane synthase [Vicinamibacterales bacterium]